MRVEANVTSGLLATDSSAVELVPLLQAEVRKLREMLTNQKVQEPERDFMQRDLVESRVVKEMKERVRELESQLADREKLIDSLDLLRREQMLEEAELDRLFLASGDGRLDDRDRDRFNIYKDDIKYNNYYSTNYSNDNNNNNNNNNVYDNNGEYRDTSYNTNYGSYSNNNNNSNNIISNNSSISNSIEISTDNRLRTRTANSINDIYDRSSTESNRTYRESSKSTSGFSPQNSPVLRSKSPHTHQSQNQTIKSLLTARKKSQDSEGLRSAHHTHAQTHTHNYTHSTSSHNESPPPPPAPPYSPDLHTNLHTDPHTPGRTPTLAQSLTPGSTPGSGRPHPPSGSRSQPVVVLSADAVDVSHPRVINLNQVRMYFFTELECVCLCYLFVRLSVDLLLLYSFPVCFSLQPSLLKPPPPLPSPLPSLLRTPSSPSASCTTYR